MLPVTCDCDPRMKTETSWHFWRGFTLNLVCVFFAATQALFNAVVFSSHADYPVQICFPSETFMFNIRTSRAVSSEWVLWEHVAGAKNPNAWKENMKQLCSFATLEDFWRYFNYIPKPSEVFYDGDSRKRVGPENKTVEEYSLFKRGIEPEWGDRANQSGGEWFCRQHFEGDMLNLYWQNLVLGVVGESIEDGADSLSTHINGCRVVDKGKAYPMFRIELWINTKNAAIKEKVRLKMLEVVTDGVPTSRKGPPKFEWKDHS